MKTSIKITTLKAVTRQLLLIILLCTTDRSLHAQPVQYLQNIPLTASAGSSNSQLINKSDIAIDNANNIYIAYKNMGIQKYDGVNWTEYTVANGSLTTNIVNSIAVTPSGGIYAGTNHGLSVYNNTIWTHYNSSNSSLPVDGVTCVEYVGTTVWAGTKHGLYSFNGSTWTQYSSSNSGLGNDTVTAIDFNGSSIYIGTENGLYSFDGANWNMLPAANAGLNSITNIEINSGEIWIVLKSGGIYYYDLALTPHSLTFPVPIGACGPYETNVVTDIKADNGYVYFFIKGLINSSNTLFRTDQTHISETYLLSFSATGGPKRILLDVRNGLIAAVAEQSNTGSHALNTQNISAQLTIPVTAELRDNAQFLNINNVSTRINNNGDLHWDPIGQVPYYTVPKCEAKNTIFSSAIWMGGLDQNNQLHLGAMTYSQMNAHDFWTGPLDTTTASTDSITSAQYNRTWKVNKVTIDDFIYNFQQGNVGNGTYQIPEVILNWPAHGGGSYSHSLAPFIDINADGNYNPYDGDYPEITGDQQIWFIFNDQMPHTESFCLPMGVEVHGKAYAYNCSSPTTGNDVINYTTFYQYKVINRSNQNYTDFKIGMFVDPDLGNAADDYVGCNVNLNTGFVYNADPDDQGAHGYGTKPPYQNVTILKGPLADANDGIDNDRDGTMDEPGECTMMENFIYYENINASPFGNPEVCDDYYQYMSSYWLDGLPVTYGGMGRDPGNPPTSFMFPGLSNPNFPGQNWTMATAGLQGTDTRFVTSTGSSTLNAGETKTIDFAYIYTRDTVGNWPIDAEINNIIQVNSIIQWFNNGLSSCPLTAINENDNEQPSLNVYPNPTDNLLHISNVNIKKSYQYEVTDIAGRICLQGSLLKRSVDVSNLKPGIYHIRVVNAEGTSNTQFVKE